MANEFDKYLDSFFKDVLDPMVKNVLDNVKNIEQNTLTVKIKQNTLTVKEVNGVKRYFMGDIEMVPKEPNVKNFQDKRSLDETLTKERFVDILSTPYGKDFVKKFNAFYENGDYHKLPANVCTIFCEFLNNIPPFAIDGNDDVIYITDKVDVDIIQAIINKYNTKLQSCLKDNNKR